MTALPVVPEWEPVLGSSLGVDGTDVDRAIARARQASDLGLLPMRWPTVWPPDVRAAALAATYAKQIGRAVAFSLACFRQAFAGGRDLGDERHGADRGGRVRDAPDRGAQRDRAALGRGRARAGQRARAATHPCPLLPAIAIGDELFQGAARARGRGRRALGVAHMKANRAFELIVSRGDASRRSSPIATGSTGSRSSRSTRRGRAVLGAAGQAGGEADQAAAHRPRSSSIAGDFIETWEGATWATTKRR